MYLSTGIYICSASQTTHANGFKISKISYILSYIYIIYSSIQIQQACRTLWPDHSVLGELGYKILTWNSVSTAFWRPTHFYQSMIRYVQANDMHTVCEYNIEHCGFPCQIQQEFDCVVADQHATFLSIKLRWLELYTTKVIGAGSYRREQASCFDIGAT
jgi:hypothetical protein